MSSTVEQIKDRIGIVDVVGSYIKLEVAGKNHKARCPFHNEKTPSFFVSPERDSFYCFGCGAKGDIFSFVEQFEGVDFMGALKILADRAGVEVERRAYTQKDPHTKLYESAEQAQRFFVEQLENNTDAQKYVEARGITKDTAQTFSLGYAPGPPAGGWRQLFDHLTTAGFSEQDLLASGLIKRPSDDSQKSKQPYDVFRSRIMFPVADASGRTVAFAGRLIGEESEKAPKYLNSPETPIFKKSETLYGFDKARQSIRKHDFAILVEGQIDLVMLHQAGFTNTVAVMGTAFTDRHAAKLTRFSKNLALALDADSAGIASALRTARTALAEGMDVKVVALPEGKDPADIINDNVEVWRTHLRGATHVVDFIIKRIIENEKDTRKAKKMIQKEAFPFITAIPNAIDRAHFISQAAKAMNIDERLVEEELEASSLELPASRQMQETETSEAPGRYDRILRQLVGIALWQKEQSDLFQKLADITASDPKELFDESEQQVVAFEAEVAYAGSEHLDRIINEMLVSLEEETLKRRFAELMERLALVEREGNDVESLEVLNECKKITARLDELKRSYTT